ncbi:putative SCAN domain-containing protein SCAND2P, partial [Clarias magur]
MGQQHKHKAFIYLFELAAEWWDWPKTHWVSCLLPLLKGQAQLTTQQLPATNMLEYPNLKR